MSTRFGHFETKQDPHRRQDTAQTCPGVAQTIISATLLTNCTQQPTLPTAAAAAAAAVQTDSSSS
eukprot:8510808-Lingulodinium_polyedra.AAC.1